MSEAHVVRLIQQMKLFGRQRFEEANVNGTRKKIKSEYFFSIIKSTVNNLLMFNIHV